MLTSAPRGTKDILPADSYKWQYLEKEFREVCKNFDFSEIRTPTFEHTELFQRGVGDTTDIVQKEMYTFDDRGKRSITLKPEGTAPSVRAFIENSLYADSQPTKLYYIIPAFRYERPQAGRLREFHQFGVELFGSGDYSADAEIISLAMTFLKSVGINDLKVNINSLGCNDCKKKYNEILKEYFKQRYDGLCDTCKERLDRNPLRILDCKNESCKEIAKDAPSMLDCLCDSCREHFEKLKAELKNLNIPFEVDPFIVRGLDYYTRTVFEIISEDLGAQSTVCGGGRYDNLIKECGGPDTPAVGFGLGVERLLLTLESKGLNTGTKDNITLYVASIGDKAKMKASYIVNELRQQGISCDRDIMQRSLKAQMKYANKINAKYTIVIGDDEVESNVVKLKNMSTGETKEIKLDDISPEIIKSMEEK